MVSRVVKYSDGGKVVMPPKSPVKPTQLPRPQSGPKPKKIGKRYADGGKVAKKPAGMKRGTRDTIAAPKPASPVDAIRNQTRRKAALLGL